MKFRLMAAVCLFMTFIGAVSLVNIRPHVPETVQGDFYVVLLAFGCVGAFALNCWGER